MVVGVTGSAPSDFRPPKQIPLDIAPDRSGLHVEQFSKFSECKFALHKIQYKYDMASCQVQGYDCTASRGRAPLATGVGAKIQSAKKRVSVDALLADRSREDGWLQVEGALPVSRQNDWQGQT